MDVVSSVRTCVDTWKSGGEAKCRNMLIGPHCNPSDSGCLNVLTTAYNTLLSFTLTTWSSKQALTADSLVTFMRSVIDVLPSTSSSNTNSNVATFGEHFVDLVWAVDAGLDEAILDAKAAMAACGDQSTDQPQTTLVRVNKVKQNAETDKATIVQIVKKLLDSGILSANVCRERLDSAILEGTGLMIKANLEKREIRMRTGLFYKQNKFNLLREQSEGYSKLTVELTSALGPGHIPSTARPSESFEAIQRRARPVWEKIISLVGFFDLDPNKALDIILDVMSVNLASHYTFFLALLSFSPWARSSTIQHDDLTMSTDPKPDQYKGKTLDEVLNLADPRVQLSSADMSPGSRVLAQILGFKLNFYQSADVPETPKSLYLTAALLIREGLVALEDLYPHLSPNDSDMENVRAAFLKHVQSRISSAKMSQLAMAAPLESTPSSAPPKLKSTPTSEFKKTPEPKDSANQKTGILIALFSVGALKPAIAILSRFPWLVDVQPEIADLIIRIMKLSISHVYDSTFITKERNPDFTQPRSQFGASGVTLPPPRKPMLSLWAPTPPPTSTVEHVFFFPDWTEQVPICTSFDDLMDVIEPLMRFIGLHVSRDPLFLTKFLRLGRQQMNTTIPVDPINKKPVDADPENPICQFWYRIIRQYLLPALPLIRGNAVCTVEIWNIIKLFDISLRWKLYGEWRSETYKSHPELRIRQVQADRESKGILRRLSHKTIESLAGPLAKLAHSDPCILFTNAVNQIMAYDNLAAVVVQALRCITLMGFDVLIFIILDALANPNKERVKDDGVNTSDWLQSLAAFAGMLFRKYNATLSPVLRYIVHQLQNGQTTEIIVLRELIWKMAGIEPLPSLSDTQIQAMAGGPALRIESIASSTRGARMDPSEGVRSSQRLGQALIETSLALPLLIQVAQQRQSSVFLARDAPLKSLAGLFDTTHGVLLQYLDLLTTPSVVSPDDYANKVLPPFRDLHEKYGISPPVCMQIIRPVLHNQLLNRALEMQEQERLANEEAEKRLKAALTAKREPSVSQSRVASPLPRSTESEAKPTSETVPPTSEDVLMESEPSSTLTATPESPWLPQLEAIFEDIKKILPHQTYDVLGPGFYITFWQLSTYDLSPPASRYDEEGAALRTLSRQEDGKYSACEKSADRSRRAMASSHRARRDRFNAFAQTLTQEFKQQTVSRAFTLKRLAREKHHWFTNVTSAAQKQSQALLLLDAFLEHCIHPRSLLSPMDADFCAQFIKILHTQGTPGFHTLACYDKILSDQIKVILFSCSEYEARNYGRFLLGVLSDLHKWHSEEPTYIQDNRSKAGGKTILHTGFQSQYRLPMHSENHLKHPAFQKVVRKWHKKIALAFVDCIQTGEFMHVYNAIIVLKEILPFFPLSAVAQETGAQLDKTMDQFLEKEERGDLKILGRAYSASLKKREQLWASTKVVSKTSSAAASRPTGPSSDRPRTAVTPVGPSAQNVLTSDIKRPPQANASAPSGPRAQLGSSKPQPVAEKSNIVAAMESVPRPKLVKRVRPDSANPGGSPKPMADQSAVSEPAKDELKEGSARTETKDNTPSKETPQPVRVAEEQVSLPMPPPSEPSQKPFAHELRVTAQQSRPDKNEDRNGRLTESSRATNGSAAPSPRRRSPSPSSHPGTRNHSSESRTSTGRSRNERGNGDSSTDKRDREPARRDSLTHNRSDRAARERTSTGDMEKDRESRRDRHGDKERDRGERDRESRDKERDREKDRDRHGDRHRRDDKAHNRSEARKDRNHNTDSNSSPAVSDDRLPSRTDGRHRNPTDEALGKRRRGTEEDADRGSKRGSSSRKDTHRDDRSRRPGDKGEPNDRPRDSDRRRRGGEGENVESSDKAESKRPPDGPQSDTKRPVDGLPRAGGKLPPLNTPSAPRAMSSSDIARSSGKNDIMSNRRDSGPTGSNVEGSVASLRSRISDKDTRPSYHGQSRNDRDSRKRPFTDRDKDSLDVSGQGTEPSSNKRLKLNRTRYTNESANLAKKALPINAQSGDRLQRGKD